MKRLTVVVEGLKKVAKDPKVRKAAKAAALVAIQVLLGGKTS